MKGSSPNEEATMTIRSYSPDDIEPVMVAWRSANALAHPFLSDTYVARSELEVRDLYIPNAETYVFEDGGKVVGFISLIGNEIGGLFLDPSRHGKGIGKALVDHAFAIKGPLKVEVFRDNRVGLPFYERYGFVLVAQELHQPTGLIVLKLAMPNC